MRFDVNLYNVILCGVAFLFLFTTFQTVSQVSQNILEAAATETTEYVGSGYVRLFVTSFMEPRAWSLYLGSIVTGLGASILWTAQGVFITNCSHDTNVNKHFSIFWALFQTSQLVGGTYTYFSLSGIESIHRELRLQLFGGFLACGGLGCILFLFLRPPKPHHGQVSTPVDTEEGGAVAVQAASTVFNDDDDVLIEVETSVETNVQDTETTGVRSLCSSVWSTCARSIRLLCCRVMFCILVACGFTGVNTTFWGSLFATSVGHTKAFGSYAKSYMGLVVIFVGLGEITGSMLMNLRRWIPPTGLVVIFGYVGALIAAYLSILMLPARSPIEETMELAYMAPNPAACMLAAFLFGMVDAVWNTQISVLVGSVFGAQKSDLPVAFALYRCVQSIMAAITFSYCDSLLLHWQVLVYLIWATGGLGCFYYACWYNRSESKTHLV